MSLRFRHVLLFMASSGLLAGYLYRKHREAEIAWHATHFRMDRQAPLPSRLAADCVPHVVHAGERWPLIHQPGDPRTYVLPSPEDAAWWALEDDGLVRYWNEDRREIFPVPVAAVADEPAVAEGARP